MLKPTLNIIAFDIPYPPLYGGTIDIFFKLKKLHEKGVRIILHCFEYNKPQQEELEKYCIKVYYYQRKKGIHYLVSHLPYIVVTRNSAELLKNLKQNDFPILFEGLHSCFYLGHADLAHRRKVVRTHNVEHDYYRGLLEATPDFLRKIYFELESRKLEHFEKVLDHADVILSISEDDRQYFSQKFRRVELIPPFHPFEEIKSRIGKGEYFLYHGKLSVEENQEAALFLIEKVFNQNDAKLIVAGTEPDNRLKEACRLNQNAELVADPTSEEMDELIANAQACVLPTFQSTGLKLKLLISLFASRFVLVNPAMVSGTSLAEVCELAETSDEFESLVDKIQNKEFDPQMIEKRKSLLEPYSNELNGEKLLKILNEK